MKIWLICITVVLILVLICVLWMIFSTPKQSVSQDSRGWIVVTDYIKESDKGDVSAVIQRLIDENPNATIFFPDGEYIIENPICTPADPTKSVDLQLSNFAVIRAGEGWSHEEAMIRLGAKDPANDIFTAGSVYSFTGGIVDGSSLASGIAIEGGRETVIKDVSIKGTVIGIHILRGANNASSDADIMNVNIVGRGGDDSVGVKLEGYDNTLTNMRIANVHYGVELRSGGNMLRNIHPLYILGRSNYNQSRGFYDACGGNFYDYCYSDQYRVGFYLDGDLANVYESCFCFWYNGEAGGETAVYANGKFNSLITSLRVGFHHDSESNQIMSVAQDGGSGVLENVLVNAGRVTGDGHEPYLTGKMIEH